MKLFKHWWKPDNDLIAINTVINESSRIPEYLKYVKRRSVCIQAGGNIGVFAKRLSSEFNRVLTFEPDEENFECLSMNLIDNNNIIKYNRALSNNEGLVSTYRIEQEKNNYGATMIKEDIEGLPCIVIDNLNLDYLDFLFLDIEGCELMALEGGVKTIDIFSPVISVELKGLSKVFGTTDTDITNWLINKGYKHVEKIGNDCIFTR